MLSHTSQTCETPLSDVLKFSRSSEPVGGEHTAINTCRVNQVGVITESDAHHFVLVDLALRFLDVTVIALVLLVILIPQLFWHREHTHFAAIRPHVNHVALVE